MAIINPWVQVHDSPAGTRSVPYAWEAGKEYMVYLSDWQGEIKITVGVIRIPFDIPAPSSGIGGMRCACGSNISVTAEIYPNGTKQFRTVWGNGMITDVIFKVFERSISPDPAEWNLAPNDDTYLMEEFFSGAKTGGSFSGLFRDYEFLFIFRAPESSSQQYYASATLYNMDDIYEFESVVERRSVLYWFHRDWAEIRGSNTTGDFDMRGGTDHNLYKVYRRKIVQDKSLGFYNCIPLVVRLGKKRGTFTRFMDYDKDYIIAGLDYSGKNELCTALMRFDQELETIPAAGQGTLVRMMDSLRVMYDSRTRRFTVITNEIYTIHERAAIPEFIIDLPDPDPEPDPDVPPPPIISCGDICLEVGDIYVAEVSIETHHDDPPDWASRGYEYTWSTPSPSLNVASVSQQGRVAVLRLEHEMTELDANTYKPFEVGVSVKDLQYLTAGVEAQDLATVTFELPCINVANETVFSVRDADIPECTNTTGDTGINIRIESNIAIVGSPVTVDWILTNGSADSSDYVGASGTMTWTEGQTFKLIPIVVICDQLPEVNETFNFVISNISRGTASKPIGIMTIVNSAINELVISQATAGESFNTYVMRDISGSMISSSDVTLNGIAVTRDIVSKEILNNFELSTANLITAGGANVTTFASILNHIIVNVPTSQANVSIFFVTDASDGYGSGVSPTTTYSSANNNHPSVVSHNSIAIGAIPISIPDVRIVTPGDTWPDVMDALPSHIQQLKVTVVRLCGDDKILTPNFITAETGFNDLLTGGPPELISAGMETFHEYTPGNTPVLEGIIGGAVLASFTAYCSLAPGTVITVQAADIAAATIAAQAQLNC